MPSIIEIRGLGKKYKLETAQLYLSLRDVISNAGKRLFNKEQPKEFWALKDINLEIKPGERVGIIGRNGAGKSTLLKILSKITPPTTGNARIQGRVASLLEVGTGFHPEMTGRENIFLNGSILGLKSAEIKQKLDAIIDFSGVEKFIDVPLKHFSSGMQLRLAFSVAAHLEPEILLIDEVLAVGDMEFQKKCIGKMEEVSRQYGKTIIFVSHQMSALTKLCERGIWIDKGQIKYDGTISKAIYEYTASVKEDSTPAFFVRDILTGDIFFKSVEIANSVIGIGDDLYVKIVSSTVYKKRNLVININIEDEWGELISHIINEDAGFLTDNNTTATILVKVRQINIQPGKYFLSFWAGLDMQHGIDHLQKIIAFEISHQNNLTQRLSGFPSQSKLILQSEWQAE